MSTLALLCLGAFVVGALLIMLSGLLRIVGFIMALIGIVLFVVYQLRLPEDD